MPTWYGQRLRGNGLLQAAGASATILASATVSYYAALCYGAVGWNGATAGAMLRLREVDTVNSNTVWIGYINTTQGNIFINLGEEGVKGSATATAFHLDTDTTGTVWAVFNGFQSRTNG